MKITSAMRLVASSKLRKAQAAIGNLLPYEQRMHRILADLLSDDISAGELYVTLSPVNKVAIVAFASNSSLCGAFNSVAVRHFKETVSQYADSGLKAEDFYIFPVGRKMADAVRKMGLQSQGDYSHMADKPSYAEASELADRLMGLFAARQVDRIELVYNHCKSTSVQIPVRETYLPVSPERQAALAGTGDTSDYRQDYIVEPDRETVLEVLLPKVLKLKIYAVLLDANAAEHSARTVAMQTATELYQLKSRVTEVYFGILTLGAMIEQNGIAEGILEENARMVEACITGGVAMESDLDVIKAEILTNAQNRIKLVGARDTYVRLMSLITGSPMDESTEFQVPPIPQYRQEYPAEEVKRYELGLLDAREASVEAQRRMLDAQVMPSFSLFAQGYYGYPFMRKNRLGQLDQSLKSIELQRETFLFNNRLEQTGKNAEIEQMRAIMEQDRQIISLRSSVREASEAKLANGTITANDLVRDIAAESKARIDKSLHELEYLQKIYEMKYIVND